MVSSILGGALCFVMGYATRWVQESGRAQAAYAATRERVKESGEAMRERFHRGEMGDVNRHGQED